MQSQYSEAVIASMTLIFGEGFLSPGGEAEVKRIIQSQTGGTSLAGRKVLDWGCGLGGTALAMVQQCSADDVLGIDIEPGNIRLAEDLVSRRGCGGQIVFQLVEPGPMPLTANFADVIFTKEALCHIEDKAPVFADFQRVLQPGGQFIGSDWMTGSDNTTSAAYGAWEDQLRSAGLSFTFTSMATHREGLMAAGFEQVEVTDDTAWTIEHGEGYVERLHGPDRPRMLKLLGEDGLAGLIVRCSARVDALRNGDLRRCHMRARKPASS